MAISLTDKLVVAISSRALFDFETEDKLFRDSGSTAYIEYQLQHMEQVAAQGVAYPMVQKLLRFNTPDAHRVEVVILSRNDPVSGLRVFHTAKALHLPLERGVFTQGRTPFRYLVPLGAKLFLSANDGDVRQALDAGFAAARVYPQSVKVAEHHQDEIRIAFDGDAVLFSDASERVYKEHGLGAFQDYEQEHAHSPLPPGPFLPFLRALQSLQKAAGQDVPVKIRTLLVTARSAPAHERAIRTLIHWGIVVDEAMFLGGLAKGPFLQEFEPDFFFDDQTGHCESAVKAGPTGHVIHGIANEQEEPPSSST